MRLRNRLLLVAFSIAATLGSLAVMALAALHFASPPAIEWDPPAFPTIAQLAKLRDDAPAPSYWLGPAGVTGALPSEAGFDENPRQLRFTYGLYCEEFDPGSGLACTTDGEVSTGRRSQPIGPELTARPSCWRPYGRAWLLRCADPYRLYTADRVVSVYAPISGDDSVSWPWQQLLPRLRRFDVPASGPRFPATTPFTCAELQAYPLKQRLALPDQIRPERCAWDRSVK